MLIELNLRVFSVSPPRRSVKNFQELKPNDQSELLTSPRFLGRLSACPRFAIAKNRYQALDLGYPPVRLSLLEVLSQKVVFGPEGKSTAQ